MNNAYDIIHEALKKPLSDYHIKKLNFNQQDYLYVYKSLRLVATIELQSAIYINSDHYGRYHGGHHLSKTLLYDNCVDNIVRCVKRFNNRFKQVQHPIVSYLENALIDKCWACRFEHDRYHDTWTIAVNNVHAFGSVRHDDLGRYDRSSKYVTTINHVANVMNTINWCENGKA